MNKITAIFFAVFFCGVTFVKAQAVVSPKLDDFIQKIETKKGELQGGAIAILYKGKVVYKTTFGYRKGKSGPVTSATLFPLASVSKSISALAIARLVDQGKMRFDEEVKLPYLKSSLSLEHILSHTTGYVFTGNWQIEQGFGREKILKKLNGRKLKCIPGECHTYSNIIYSLAEEALNAKGVTLEQAIEQLKVALDTQGVQLITEDPSLNLAYPHTVKKSKNKKKNWLQQLPFPPYYPKTAPAAAGVFASLDGMIEVFKLSFGYRPDLISKQTLDRLYQKGISNKHVHKWGIKWPCKKSKLESYYGLGWRILRAQDHPSKDLIFHSGFISGVNSFIGFIPAEEIGIIILLNQDSGIAVKTGISFWGEFLK